MKKQIIKIIVIYFVLGILLMFTSRVFAMESTIVTASVSKYNSVNSYAEIVLSFSNNKVFACQCKYKVEKNGVPEENYTGTVVFLLDEGFKDKVKILYEKQAKIILYDWIVCDENGDKISYNEKIEQIAYENVETSNYITNIKLKLFEKSNKLFLSETSNRLVSDVLKNENLTNIDLYQYSIIDNNGVVKDNQKYCGSKDKIIIKDLNNNILEEIIIIVKGDISGNGQIKIYDSFQILKGVLSNQKLDEIDSAIRDYNDDKAVTIYDAFQFLKQSLK